MQLSAPFFLARHQGRLGLIVYTIPGFPTVDDSDAILRFLQEHDAVSVIENTIPVTHGFSDHANATIRAAHTAAAKNATEAMIYERWSKPSLCVLYRSTADAVGFEQVCARASGIFDGMILEWSEPNEKPYVEIAARHGIELVQCIGPWHSTERIGEIMQNVRPGGLVYLMSAEMTGADLFPVDTLADCVARARAFRPDIVVAAGFGVRTPAHVRTLATVPGLDGVIIGTEFLRQLEGGAETARRYLDTIIEALPLPASSSSTASSPATRGV
jgi:tryptophan synthase alpha subunit